MYDNRIVIKNPSMDRPKKALKRTRKRRMVSTSCMKRCIKNVMTVIVLAAIFRLFILSPWIPVSDEADEERGLSTLTWPLTGSPVDPGVTPASPNLGGNPADTEVADQLGQPGVWGNPKPSAEQGFLSSSLWSSSYFNPSSDVPQDGIPDPNAGMAQQDFLDPNADSALSGFPGPNVGIAQSGFPDPNAGMAQSGFPDPNAGMAQSGVLDPNAAMGQSGFPDPIAGIPPSGFLDPTAAVGPSGFLDPNVALGPSGIPDPNADMPLPNFLDPNTGMPRSIFDANTVLDKPISQGASPNAFPAGIGTPSAGMPLGSPAIGTSSGLDQGQASPVFAGGLSPQGSLPDGAGLMQGIPSASDMVNANPAPPVGLLPSDQTNVNGNANIVLYNHVQNGLNSFLADLFNKLKAVNQLNYVSNLSFRNKELGNYQDRKQVVEQLFKSKQPTLYDRHMFMINFTNFQSPWPSQISIIRDPVDLMKAMFNFEKTKCRTNQNSCRIPVRRGTLDQCVMDGAPFCKCEEKGVCMTFVPFFCGTSPSCKRGSVWALEQAKENIDKHFNVVGVSEHLMKFLQVLEKILPSVFKSSSRVAMNMKRGTFVDSLAHPEINAHPHLENKTIQMLYNRFKYDNALYLFAKQRFYLQYNSLFRQTPLTKP